jgi:CO/xanthine dehydrogenase Mo-binding subunit
MSEKNCCEVIGRSVRRVDSHDKLSGNARYAGDISFPGMLQTKVLRSDRPHAKILAIRTEAATAHPGVVAVLTHADIPGKNVVGLVKPDQTVLCVDKVRYIGDPVALVAAESEEAAEAALALIEVDYEDLPGVFSPEEALRPDAPPIHAGGNLLKEHTLLKGDPEGTLAGAEVVIRNTYRTQMVEHAYLEPEAGVAIFENGKATVWTPSKYAHSDQREMSVVLGLATGNVRVVNTTVGGCFGDKTSLSAGYYAALAAVVTGRPARTVYSREESFFASRKRHPFTIDYTLGATREGKLLAAKIDILVDGGAYTASSPTVMFKALVHAAGPYDIPHVAMKLTFAYTNNPVGGSMRGLGVPQTAFAHESQIDLLARELGMDPFDLRLKNAMRPGTATATGHRLNDSVALVETIERVRREVKAAGTPPATAAKRYGWGVGSMFYGIGQTARPNPGRARVEVDSEGRFTLYIGIGDVGQGSSTAMTQIAAEALKRPLEAIRIVAGDTASCPDSGVTAASRVTYIVGKAVEMAAVDLLGQLKVQAAALLGIDAARLSYDGEGFRTAGGGGRRVAVAEAVRAARQAGIDPCGRGEYDPPFTPLDGQTGQGEPMATYAFATQAALVGVDMETGEVEVLKVIACHDVGRAVNPAAVEGQIEGAVSMGLGFSLSEEILLQAGRIRNPGFSQYFVATVLDMPEIRSLIAEAPESSGPFGAKGVGEPALIPTAPAVVNAIHAAAGIRVKELPATAEKVWRLLQGRPPAVS